MPTIIRTKFYFDERSLVSIEKLVRQGVVGEAILEIIVRDPETGKDRTMLILKNLAPESTRGSISSTFG